MALTAALFLPTIFAGCRSTDEARIDAAAAVAGRVAAGVTLAEWPPSCREHMDRVVPKIGEKARWVQRRWEIVAEAKDRTTDNCSKFYDDVRAGLAGKDAR